MRHRQPLNLDCPGCSHRFELSEQQSTILSDEQVECPQCGQFVPLPPADDRPDVDSGPEEAPFVEKPAPSPGVSTTRTAGRRQRKSSPVGFIIAVLLGPITLFGICMLFPNLPHAVARFLSDFAGKVEVNDPSNKAAGQRAEGHPIANGNGDENVRIHRTADDLESGSFDRPHTAAEKTEIGTQPATEPKHPIPKPKEPSPEKRAKRADNKLRLAKILLKRGEKSDAKRWFQEIVDEYPGTKAAEEARQLLGGL